jgi:parallel beta-helix repeat protein
MGAPIMRLATCVAGLLVLIPIAAAPAAAQPLRCGGTVKGSVKLTSDLTCRTGHGLVVANGAALDCAGHRITGGDRAQQYGVYVKPGARSVVRNCVAEHFDVGIRVVDVAGATIASNTSRANRRYGVEITQESSQATVTDNAIVDNGDEGLHVSGPASRDAAHRIARNTLDGNAREGIYLLRSNGSLIADNLIQHHGAAGIYVKGSARNTITGNTLVDDPLQLVAGAASNVLANNTIVGQAIKFADAPDNEVYNHSVQGRGGKPSVAYDFSDSPHNLVVDSEAVDAGDYAVRARDGSTDNVFMRFSTAPRLDCSVDGTSTVSVTDPAGAALDCDR